MKRWLSFILAMLVASAFGHAPERLLGSPLKNSQLLTLNSHQYSYQAGGQGATQTRTDGSSVNYLYDGIGQLSQARGSGGQSTERLGYSYDAAWNLSQRTNGLSVMSFQVDGQNQLTTAPDGACKYDLNGNLISAKNGRETYDDENRLIRVTQYASANVPGTQTALAYAGLSRLRSRREYTWVATKPGNRSVTCLGTTAPTAARTAAESGTWQLSTETRYLYDGRRVIQERNGNNVPLVSYTRGPDLSGSLEGAGGIGGLLGRSHGYHNGSGAWSTHNYYHSDGAGNVTYLVNSSQTLAASYRYDPYGNLLASSGPLAAANVYRFSSKEVHLNSGLYAYGYRFYSPNWQRWVSQDPIGERGGLNLYGFVGNRPVNFLDPNGLWGIQFGNFNIGYGNPNLAFDNDSWMDLANGATATADGLIPFGDPFADLYQNGEIWSDDNEGLSDYERSLYEKSKTGGKIAQQCLLTAAIPGIRVVGAGRGAFTVGSGIAARNAAYQAGVRGGANAGRYYSELIARNTFRNGAPATANTLRDFFTTLKYTAGESEVAINWMTGKLTHFIP